MFCLLTRGLNIQEQIAVARSLGITQDRICTRQIKPMILLAWRDSYPQFGSIPKLRFWLKKISTLAVRNSPDGKSQRPCVPNVRRDNIALFRNRLLKEGQQK